jgi:hypothetical protein
MCLQEPHWHMCPRRGSEDLATVVLYVCFLQRQDAVRGTVSSSAVMVEARICVGGTGALGDFAALPLRY